MTLGRISIRLGNISNQQNWCRLKDIDMLFNELHEFAAELIHFFSTVDKNWAEWVALVGRRAPYSIIRRGWWSLRLNLIGWHLDDRFPASLCSMLASDDSAARDCERNGKLNSLCLVVRCVLLFSFFILLASWQSPLEYKRWLWCFDVTLSWTGPFWWRLFSSSRQKEKDAYLSDPCFRWDRNTPRRPL